MADAYVFTGPTLSPTEGARVLAATYLPPARQGDVYRLMQHREPKVIGIVDGYFSQVPAVWHKELLWAMAHGVHVFGAASMGALRAVELERFGMHGVGRIFEAYRVSEMAPDFGEAFEDDDEVAVVHGPPEAGYVPVSDALVNLRASLAAAAGAGVIDDGERRALLARLKQTFYADRSRRRLPEACRAAGLAPTVAARLGEWLAANYVDQKKLDALAMLERIGQLLARSPPAFEAPFRFEHTAQWQLAVDDFEAERGQDRAADADGERVLDELRLHAPRYLELRHAAQARALGLEHVSGGTGARAAAGLPAVEQADTMMTGAHGDTLALAELWGREQRARRFAQAGEALPAEVVSAQMLSILRARPDYAELHARARDKRQRLGGTGDTGEFERLDELQRLALSDWFFSRVAGTEMPADERAFARALDLEDAGALHRLLFDEFRYRRSLED